MSADKYWKEDGDCKFACCIYSEDQEEGVCSGCSEFTTIPTVSITKERLAELERCECNNAAGWRNPPQRRREKMETPIKTLDDVELILFSDEPFTEIELKEISKLTARELKTFLKATGMVEIQL